uniref:PCI domain-containing protein n=1 Tax=Rhinopithecus roxellana TaxID=61622 RepID=A0A2K6NH16_RHIRO
MRADRCIVKMEVDYSATVVQHLPECEKLAKEGRLQEVIETFLSLEKQTHTASDMVSTSQILVAVVKMCYEANEWDLLNENITLLSKRRSQLIQAVAKMQNGDVKEAASILRELQVETYGSMQKKEQVEFILEQMRLFFPERKYREIKAENTEKLKLKLNLMIQLDQHEGSNLFICKHYRAIYNTPCIWAESEKWQVLYSVILAPFDNEQSDLVHQISRDKKSEEIPQYKDLLKLFTTMELMCWSTLVEDYGMELRKGSLENPATDVFGSTEEGEKRWKDLKNRVITMKRMVQLLDLSVDESEAFLSNLVVNKTIFAKVDRLAGINNFQRFKDPNNLLNDWFQKLNSLMSLVNKTTHLIAKEEMIHNLQ